MNQDGPIHIRQDLALAPTAPDIDGAPQWVLHDALSQRYFRLGAEEVALLDLLDHPDAAAIATTASARLGRQVTPAAVGEFRAFLRQHNLVAADVPQQRWYAKQVTRRPDFWQRFARSYLFIRIPLFKPDRFLTESLPYVTWLGRRWVQWGLGLCAALGLFLAMRQSEDFVATFMRFFSLEGLLFYALALTGVKILHELGHAYVAKYHGCRVPTIGLALLVFWPVLYTDTTAAWGLASRRAQRAIDAAGIRVELGIAALALLAWSLVPDGILRSLCFLLATTTWVLTLLVNLNPFMRFDGYYLLADSLGVANLEARAFALARWRLREWLFGLGLPPPEPPRTILILHAFGTWLYRFFLFLGIALLVYHFFIKAVGVILFLLEITYFILRPIAKEIMTWLRTRAAWRWNRQTRRSLMLVLGVLLLVNIPWQGRLYAPALCQAHYTRVYALEAGYIRAIEVENGDWVRAGQRLVEATRPELAHELAMARSRLTQLEQQQAASGFNRRLLAQSRAIGSERRTQIERIRGLEARRAALEIVAPHAGMVTDRNPDIKAGTWVGKGERLLAVMRPEALRLTAYLREAQLGRVQIGARGRFYPQGGAWPSFPVTVTAIAPVAVEHLESAYLASTRGGPIAVREADNGSMTPVDATYRVRLQGEPPGGPPPRAWRGTVVLRGQAQSLLLGLWRRLLGLWRREAGF